MADNFLEKHREEYELRKAAYLRKKKHLPKMKARQIERPDDEALSFFYIVAFICIIYEGVIACCILQI